MAYKDQIFHGGQNQPDQVTDEFLTCKLCNIPGFKSPKILKCGHTFCEVCLEDYIQALGSSLFPCPLCQKINQVPAGGVQFLKDNLFVYNQVDRLLRRHNNAMGRDDSFYRIVKY